jgi:hypothetical protein
LLDSHVIFSDVTGLQSEKFAFCFFLPRLTSPSDDDDDESEKNKT